MKDSVRFRIDSSVQPVLVVVDSDRLLIDRDAIRALSASGLEIGFLYPVMNSRPTPFDTQLIKENNCIRQ